MRSGRDQCHYRGSVKVMPSSNKWLLAAPVEIPRRDPHLVGELVKWLGAGGYAPHMMRAEREGRTASDRALRAALAFLERLHPVDFAYELGAPATFGAGALASMVVDSTVIAIHLSNAAGVLRLPLTKGFLTGYFELI